MSEAVAKPLSIKSLRSLALDIRKIFDCEQIMRFPIVEFIEKILPYFDVDYEIVPKEKMPEEYALTRPDEKIIFIREDVYSDAVDDNGRARFTLAHELGHLLLHTESNICFARSECYIPPYKNPEWQANTFAAELLIPQHLVKDMSIEDVMKQCCVSRKCASIQLDKYKKKN